MFGFALADGQWHTVIGSAGKQVSCTRGDTRWVAVWRRLLQAVRFAHALRKRHGGRSLQNVPLRALPYRIRHYGTNCGPGTRWKSGSVRVPSFLGRR